MTDAQTYANNLTNWLATVSMDEFLDIYSERYRDAYGIRARWVYGRTYTREEMADMWNRLDLEIEASNARDKAEDEAFRQRMADCGLSGWAERNNINNDRDLEEYNYSKQFEKIA